MDMTWLQEARNDDEYSASEEDSNDDEATVEEQEKHEKTDHKQELDDLQAEGTELTSTSVSFTVSCKPKSSLVTMIMWSCESEVCFWSNCIYMYMVTVFIGDVLNKILVKFIKSITVYMYIIE